MSAATAPDHLLAHVRHDLAQVAARAEHAVAHPLQRRRVAGRDRAADHQHHVAGVQLVQPAAQPRAVVHVGAGEDRETDRLRVLLDDRADDLVHRLVAARVDDLHARVLQRLGDHLGAAVVAVQPGLGHDDADGGDDAGHGTRPSRSSSAISAGSRSAGSPNPPPPASWNDTTSPYARSTDALPPIACSSGVPGLTTVRPSRPGSPSRTPNGRNRWRSDRLVNRMSSPRMRTSRRTPSPPRKRPRPAEPGISSNRSTITGVAASTASTGMLAELYGELIASQPSRAARPPVPPWISS